MVLLDYAATVHLFVMPLYHYASWRLAGDGWLEREQSKLYRHGASGSITTSLELVVHYYSPYQLARSIRTANK